MNNYKYVCIILASMQPFKKTCLTFVFVLLPPSLHSTFYFSSILGSGRIPTGSKQIMNLSL
jgi:hypothetical protein